MKQVHVRGDIIPNEYKWVYEYFGWDSVCPQDISTVINQLEPGEELEVLINSGGGSVQAGQELYSLFKSVNSTAKIQSFAASAAGVAAMGCKRVLISDVGTIMIHNVSCGGVSGDYHEMDKASEMLKKMNEMMSSAYVAKSGRPMKEILDLMDKETWLTAKQALKYGFADEILQEKPLEAVNSLYGLRLTEETMQQALKEVKEKKDRKDRILEDLELYGV